MASATRASATPRAPLPIDNDFPSLSTKSANTPPRVKNKAGPRFSDLAQSWGVQQKEEDEQKKQYAKEKMTEQRLKKEQEEKELGFYRVGLVNTSCLFSSKREEHTYEVEREEEEDGSEVYEEEEEEYDAAELDAGWNQRRNKNDL